MEEIIKVPEKGPKGEDQHKVFSVRLPVSLVIKLDDIAAKANQSRNEVVRIFLDFCVNHYGIEPREPKG